MDERPLDLVNEVESKIESLSRELIKQVSKPYFTNRL